MGVKIHAPPGEQIEPAFPRGNIPVFFGCDDQFFPHVLVVIASFMERAAVGNNYDIIVVESGVSPERMATAVDWMRQWPNASLRFVSIDEMVEAVGREHFPATRSYPVAVFFRLFAPSIFAKYDKIAYLDADIVVFADIADFYNQDLEGKPLAACHDYVSERQSAVNPLVGDFWRRQLGKEPGEDAFLSGGIVMNLRLMRALGTERAMLEKMRGIEGAQLPDQDVMNAVLRNQVRYLGCDWNYLDWMNDPLEESLNFSLVSDAAAVEVRRNRDRFKVIHYAEKKPWTIDYAGKNGDFYWHYAAKTPFHREIAERHDAECALSRLAGRYLVLSLQAVNFHFRLAFCRAADKRKYAARLHNVRMKRRAIVKHLRRRNRREGVAPGVEF